MRILQKGFTLLELLVAFAISALALGVLYEGALTSLTGTHRVAQQARALAIARSQLAALDPPGAVGAGTWNGDVQGGFHWTLTVVPRAAAGPGGVATARPLVLYDARVLVTWPGLAGQRRRVTLDTRRAAAPP